MKTLLAFAAAASLCAPCLVLADEVSKNAKIEEMMRISQTDKVMKQVLDQMKSTVMSQVSKVDSSPEARKASEETQQRILALLTERLSWDRAKPAFIKMYSETFTESEIEGILTFYKSPAGQAMLQKMPQLIQRSMAVGQQLVGDVSPDIQRIVEDVKQKYQK